MDHLFGRANIAQASAGAMVLLATVVALVAPLLYARHRAAARSGA
jgi:glucose/mannose transport system permease protein